MPKRSWVMSLCVAAGLAVGAAGNAQAVPDQCAAQVNDTPSKLLPCIRTADLWAHMVAFQDIANANPGPDGHPSRNSGEPGYLASANYVAGVMRDAGYNVSIQTYTFDYSSFVGTPTFSEVSPTPRTFALVNDWNQGRATGRQQAPPCGRRAAS